MDQIFANMNFNKIGNTKLIVGSHPWNAADIFDLHEYNGVKAIENLQQGGEPDRGDIDAITVECAKLGIWYPRVPVGFLHYSLQHFQITQMNHVWCRCITAMIGMQLLGLMTIFNSWLLVTELVDIGCQIQDGSHQSVRANLPKAVRILYRALTEKAKNANDTVYLHCCKGLGRSPSVAAAYLYWFPKEILTVSFRFSTCIYVPCNFLSSADLFINVLQLLILSLVFLYVI